MLRACMPSRSLSGSLHVKHSSSFKPMLSFNWESFRAKEEEMANRLKSHGLQSPSMAELRFKFTRIVSHHDQLKVAFHQLKSQIEIGLLEAEDVFRSLAIPLTKLVGLKTVEMAEDGRTSTIYMASDLRAQSCWRNEIRTESPASSPSVTERVDQNHKIPISEEDYTTNATMAGKELMQKQRLQLTQLVHLLRKIETEVNSSQHNIFQTISDHQASMHKFFQKAITYISAVYQSGQSHDAFLVTLKILKATFNQLRDVLGSVLGGVDDLMQELAQLMFNPMVEYVKGLKAEITTGTCPRLLAMVEEMGGAIKDGRLELEEARMKVRRAEERKAEALSRLEESEERVRKFKMQLGFFLEAKKGAKGHYTQHKFLRMEEDQTKDEKLLWELLKKKRKYRTPDSPFGPTELLCIGTNNKHLKSTKGRPLISCKPIARSPSLGALGLSPQTPHLDSWMPLGSSPSATAEKCLSRKRITP